MKRKDTFSLSETYTKEFWDKVLYVEEWHSSGLGGPGALWIITTERLLYQIGFETFPYDEHRLEKFNDFFAIDSYDKVNLKRVYKIEKNGWNHLPAHQYGNNIWVKDEFVDEFVNCYKAATSDNRHLFCPQLFAEIIGVSGEIERVTEEKFAELLEKEHRLREKQDILRWEETLMKLNQVENFKNYIDEVTGEKWLKLWADEITYYCRILNFGNIEERQFLTRLVELLDEALIPCLTIEDVEDMDNTEKTTGIRIVDKDTFFEMCVELNGAYKQHLEDRKHYSYMTFSYLKEIMEKHNIPEDVRFLSNSGWECGATDMPIAYYHKEDNILEFIQYKSREYPTYPEERGWKEVSHIWDEREGFFDARYYKYKKLKGIEDES